MPAGKILIVEDEGLLAMDLEEQLEGIGYEVAGVALSGMEALEILEIVRPDLVLMDISLKSGMDGVELAGEFKEKFGVPVVFITGNSDERTRKRAMSIGPAAYIQKPIVVEDMRRAIESVLG
jgi:CheY-like chemotaxis protein